MLTIITEAPPWVFRWIDPIHDGSFSELLMDGSGDGGRAKNRPPLSLRFFTHILHWWNLPQIYLTYKRFKEYINNVTYPLISPDILLLKIIKFCCIKKCRYRFDYWYIICNSFYFFWVFKNYFNKNGCNFDDASKNGYYRHFEIKVMTT